jgi:uncharacterized protein with beta-barrel porin domain
VLDRLKGAATGDLADVTLELAALDDESLARSLDAISGEIHASNVHLSAIDGESVTDAIRSEMTNRGWQRRREGGGGRPDAWGFPGARGWFHYRGERASLTTNHSSIGRGGRSDGRAANGSINGFTMGVDWTHSGRWLVGAGGSYGSGRMILSGLRDSTTFAAPRAVAYLGYARSWWTMNGGANVARASYNTARSLQFMALAPGGGRLFKGVDRTVTSRQSGLSSEFWGEFRADTHAGSWQIQPAVGLRHARYAKAEWAEAGAESLSLSAPAQAIDSLQADVGVRFSRALGRFRPYAGASARRELTDGGTAVTLSLAPGADGLFAVSGLKLPEGLASAQAGVMYQADKFSVSVMYEARHARQQTRHTIQLAIGFQ